MKSKKTEESLAKTLKQIDQRLKKLESVSHKQPDMKLILRDAVKVLQSVKKEDAIKSTKRIPRAPKIPKTPAKDLKVRC
jgi:cell fate (sporulation/competence/biofilm development) regulator YmcA (YheA/YmcA/DUF963 family)